MNFRPTWVRPLMWAATNHSEPQMEDAIHDSCWVQEFWGCS